MALPIYLRVGNIGPRQSVGTKVTFTGLEQLEVVSSAFSIGSFNASSGVWSIGLLNVGDEHELELSVENETSSTVVVEASISGKYLDPDISNNVEVFKIGVIPDMAEDL